MTAWDEDTLRIAAQAQGGSTWHLRVGRLGWAVYDNKNDDLQRVSPWFKTMAELGEWLTQPKEQET